jgi:Uma2 family endonuclease
MAEAQRRLMTVDEFYLWQLDQDERYELVEGVPVPLRAMTGASNEHDTILVNCIIELGTRLRGKPCRVVSADTALRTTIRTTRRPDVMIECAPPQPKTYEARKPAVVIEVLSPSTRKFDMLDKLEEYRRMPSLRHILLIDPDTIAAQHYRRAEGGEWRTEALRGKDTEIAFAAIEVSFPLGVLYDRLDVPE